MSASSTRILHQDPKILTAAIEGTFVNIWTAPRVDLASMRKLAETQKALVEERERKPFGVLVLVDVDRAGGIDRDAKELSVVHAKEMAPYVLSNAQVPLGGTFKVLAALGVMKATAALSRPAHPSKVIRDLEEASRWLAGLQEGVDARVLAREARRLYDEQH